VNIFTSASSTSHSFDRIAVRRVADSTIRRLSLYLNALEEIQRRGGTTVSSEELAQMGGTTSAQVRKDLSVFGSFGKRGLGYAVPELITRLRTILGLGKRWRVCIIGAGKVGAALSQYPGFPERGFDIVAVYDVNPARIGERWGSLTVRDIASLERDIPELRCEIAVLAVPAPAAQRVAERIVRAGIRAILNFVPVQLNLPGNVAVRTVNMAMELEALSFALTNR
jgi:redox-sensing transcriptional repressor